MPQHTFGESFGLDPMVPVEPGLIDPVDCSVCGESVSRPVVSDSGDHYCDCCYSDNYARCERCNSEVSADDCEHSPDGDSYCEPCFNRLYFCCDSCNETVSTGDRVNVNCESLCDSCYSENYAGCEDCGDSVHCDDWCSTDDGIYCQSCYENRNSGDFDAIGFRPAGNTYARTGGSRTFGVELETNRCDDYMDLDGKVHFSSRDDGSISGKEFVSAVLSGDKGLDAIESFCAKAARLGFSVDKSCGFHAHFGMADMTVDQLKAVAWGYQSSYAVWASFVSDSRRGNHYCGQSSWRYGDLRAVSSASEFREFADNQDRYQWLNLAAFVCHGTFEVRLHTATLESDKICNWVIAHLRFIEYVKNLPLSDITAMFSGSIGESFDRLAEIWDSEALAEYYRERAKQFGTYFRVAAQV